MIFRVLLVNLFFIGVTWILLESQLLYIWVPRNMWIQNNVESAHNLRVHGQKLGVKWGFWRKNEWQNHEPCSSVSCHSFSISSTIFKLCIVVRKTTKYGSRFFSEWISHFCCQKHAWLSKNPSDKAFFQKLIFLLFSYIWASEMKRETNKSLFLTSCDQ